METQWRKNSGSRKIQFSGITNNNKNRKHAENQIAEGKLNEAQLEVKNENNQCNVNKCRILMRKNLWVEMNGEKLRKWYIL